MGDNIKMDVKKSVERPRTGFILVRMGRSGKLAGTQ
jgi:hypothetical protein